MKKMQIRTFIVTTLFLLIVFNYVINSYDFFSVLKKAFTPVIIGFVIAYLLDPLVKIIIKMSKGKIKRNMSIFIAVLISLGGFTLFAAVLFPSIVNSATDIAGKINQYFEHEFSLDFFENMLTQVDNDIVAELIDFVDKSLKDIATKVGEWSGVFIEGLIVFALSASKSVLNFFMAFVISIYMLGDKNDLLLRIKRFNYAINKKDTADMLLDIVHKSDEIFSSFFIGKIIDSTIIGLLCFAIMWMFKIPNSPAIGFIIGITNIIPYFGPFIGAVPSIIITLASGDLTQGFIVLIVIVALQQFDGLYLGPKILGGKVGVGAFWIIVSVSVGGSLFGLVGMFIGVPVVVLIKTLVEEYVESKLESKKIDV